MPTLRDAALLASHVYKDEAKDAPAGWSRIEQTNQSGYQGTAYLNIDLNELAIVHRGTHWDFKKPPIVSNNVSSDIAILSQLLPHETPLALAFSKAIVQKYQSQYRYIQIGHSLGGFYAHWCGYELLQPVITFDAPGCKEILLHKAPSLNKQQCKQHYSFFGKTNFANNTNTSIGSIYINVKEPNIFLQSSTTFEEHRMKYFLDIIQATSVDPTTMPFDPTPFEIVDRTIEKNSKGCTVS